MEEDPKGAPFAPRAAGSENSDRSLSGNSGHLSVALQEGRIAGVSISGEGKDDQHAQATRDPSASTGGPYPGGGGRAQRRAHFPFLKTIDDFNFTYESTLRLQVLGSALSPDFVTEGRSLIVTGKPGRGKTHLAVAIAYRAIQNGFDAYFTTAATLIDDPSAAFREGQLAQALPTYTHPAVLVVD